MITFTFLHPRATEEHLGLIPHFFVESDTRPAREQIDDRYRHGGGFFPINGFKHQGGGAIKYPGDPVMKPIAEATLHDEHIYLYEYGWCMILQPDGSFEVCGMD